MIPSRIKRSADAVTDASLKKLIRRDPSPSIGLRNVRDTPVGRTSAIRREASSTISAPMKKMPPTASQTTSAFARKPTPTAARISTISQPSALGVRSRTISRSTIASARDLPKPAKTQIDTLKDEISSLKESLQRKEEELTKKEEEMVKKEEEMVKKEEEMAKKEEELVKKEEEVKSSKQQEDRLERALVESCASVEAAAKLESFLRKEVLQTEEKLKAALNQLVDLKGQVRVAVRVRPTIDDETGGTHLEFPSPSSIVVKTDKAPATFECTRVFAPSNTQTAVYNDISDLVQSAMDGYNVSIIAYGQTGSGKTFTMIGGQDDQRGIIPRAVENMFAFQKKKRLLNWEFSFRASYLEIYNEDCYDLLNNREKVLMRSTGAGATFENLASITISKPEQIINLIYTAGFSRVTAKTACNAQSSRSHVIFQLHIDGKQLDEGTSFSSRLDLVDLAGSERAKESQVEAEQFKEMTCINQSLSTLMQCIRAVRCKTAHVPYRDSKLTSALRSSIGGNSKTMMIVAISPSVKHIMESRRSLEFAQQVSSMRTGPATSLIK